MKSLSFYGASGTVTGSCYMLKRSESPGILIDCGMYQGTDEVVRLNQIPLAFNSRELDGVLLTHAHLDHCGRLPLLIKNGYKGKIYMTEPTYDLTEIVLMDAARIAEKEESITAIYTEDDVLRTLEQAEIIEYDAPFELGHFKVTYRDAGHIMGSACIEIRDPGADDGIETIIFSGDLGNLPHSMLEPTYMFDSADIVVMESTYGGRNHPKDDAKTLLQKSVNAAESADSTLLIPAFAIERTQEILYQLKQLKDTAKIKAETPVFLDSPMAIRVTEVYRRYGGYYNDTFHDVLMRGEPFEFPGLSMVKKHKQSRAIDMTMGVKVIIAGSGMMTGGRILKHAKKYLPLDSSELLFVGYQGEETLGREILNGAQTVHIQDSDIAVKAKISSIASLSGHADESQLLEWLGHMSGVKKVFLTHGEDDARLALSKKIKEEKGISDVIMPDLNDEVLISK